MYQLEIPLKVRRQHFAEFGKKVHDCLKSLYETGMPCPVCAELIPKAIRKANDFVIKTKDYFSHYKEFVDTSIERNLLTAKPDVLLDFLGKEECYRRNHPNVMKQYWGYWEKLLRDIFKWETFAKSTKKWDAGKFIEELNIHTCCYCNADVVFSRKFVSRSHKRYRSALDHFYSRDIFPFFALSLYNLVPVCNRCNSQFKLKIQVASLPLPEPTEPKGKKGKYRVPQILPLMNPYADSLCKYFKFIFAPKKSSEVYCYPPTGRIATLPVSEAKDFSLKKCIVENNLATFCVEEVYNKLYGYMIQDTMMKRYLLGDWYGTFFFEHYFGKLHSRVDLYAWKKQLFGISFSNEDINKRPFSKLIIDLAGDL